jgi:thymidylate synthase (FAD)
MTQPLYRKEVLDHGFVELLDVMPHYKPTCERCAGVGHIGKFANGILVGTENCPDCEGRGVIPRDIVIVNAARTSYLGQSKGVEADKKLLKYLYKNRHTTPFEQIEFQFRVKAPIVVWWQWVRHRTWNYNLQSGRYTEYEDEFYIPKKWRLQDIVNKQGSTEEFITSFQMKVDAEPEYGNVTTTVDISKHFEDRCKWDMDFYHQLVEAGVAKEQSRMFLPAFALYHEGYAKVDAKNLLDFLRLRTDEHAQWEIRQYALAIEEIFREVLPWTYELFKENK